MATKTPNECPTSCSGGCVCRFVSKALCRSVSPDLPLPFGSCPFRLGRRALGCGCVRSLFDLAAGVGG